MINNAVTGFYGTRRIPGTALNITPLTDRLTVYLSGHREFSLLMQDLPDHSAIPRSEFTDLFKVLGIQLPDGLLLREKLLQPDSLFRVQIQFIQLPRQSVPARAAAELRPATTKQRNNIGIAVLGSAQFASIG